MSNVLKKITKKYKWLRFLNYKTTKLAVLSAALFGLCLSSGQSFAKYRDENYGGGNAGAAKFEYGMVTFTPKSIQEPSSSDGLEDGTHAFSLEFQLEIPVVEVSISYSIRLRLLASDVNDFYTTESGLSNTSFVSNNSSDSFCYFLSNNNVVSQKKEATLSEAVGESITYSAGSWYKGAKDNIDGDYTWEPSTSVEANDVILFDSGTVEAGNSLTRYFKTIIFIDPISNGNEFNLEDSQLLYSYNVEQVVA